MQQLQMNLPWECGSVSLINSYLAFSFFHFSMTILLQLGVIQVQQKQLNAWEFPLTDNGTVFEPYIKLWRIIQ